jgi:gliding motility-associated-like protein
LLSDGPIWVQPLQSQTYRLVVLEEEGCRATASVVIEVNGQVDVYVPTAFSPDGNDNNELFRPYAGSQVQSIRVFKVFDRWGELLYNIDTDPLRESGVFGWDGRLRGKLMDPQVFVWQMEVELIDGSFARLFGDFVLMR